MFDGEEDIADDESPLAARYFADGDVATVAALPSTAPVAFQEGKISFFDFAMKLANFDQDIQGCLTLLEIDWGDKQKLAEDIAIIQQRLQAIQPQLAELFTLVVDTTCSIDRWKTGMPG